MSITLRSGQTVTNGVTLRGGTPYIPPAPPIIETDLILNLDPATGISGSTWQNTAPTGSALDYHLYNNPGTATVNGYTVLDFPGGTSQDPGSMTFPYAWNPLGLTPLASPSQAFTIDIWACPNALNAGCLIKEYGNYTTGAPTNGWEDGWISFSGGDIAASVYAYGGGNNVAGSYTVGHWYHVVMTYNGSNQLKFYVNGQLGNTQNFSRTANGTYCQLSVAGCDRYSYLGSDRYFDGYVGPFKVYEAALDATQVLQNYNALKGRFGL